MRILNRIKKHMATKAYAKKLPVVLKNKYGRHKRYNAKQIQFCIEVYEFDTAFMDIAMAMYMSRLEYARLKSANAGMGDYDELRKQVANSFFGGNTTFTIHDALRSSSTYAARVESGLLAKIDGKGKSSSKHSR